MDYEKKYKEALEQAKKELATCGSMDCDAARLIFRLFPQLRESEDDALEFLKGHAIEWIASIEHDISQSIYEGLEGHSPENERELARWKKALAWLEKQKINTEGDFARGYDCGYEACLHSHGAEWFEKQKEIPMPNSTELIEMWHEEKEMLKEKDFRGDEWRLAYHAYMDGFARGTCVKFEKQIEQKNTSASTMIPSCHEELTEFELVLFNAILDNNFVGAKGSENALAMTKKVAPALLAIAKKEPDWNKEKCFICQEYEKGFKQGHLEGCTAGYNKAMEEMEQKEQKPVWADIPYCSSEPEWSEEDEKMLYFVTEAVQFRYSDRELAKYLNPKIINEKKQLKQRLFNWLRDLRPSWKPSEEQMTAVLRAEGVLRLHGQDDVAKRIAELYEQLKAL